MPKPPLKSKSEHVSKILAVGREKGYITYKQVNDILPDDVVSSEEIDDILQMLGENDIKVVDHEDKHTLLTDDDRETDGQTLPGAVVGRDDEEDESDR